MASAGEPETRTGHLEKNLSEILDIAHTWRAVLLIDEADVFLEQRDVRDVVRNALIQIRIFNVKARKHIWKSSINRVRALPDVKVADVSEDDYKKLSECDVNRREIKNAVRTAQSIALNEKEMLSMKHLLQVLFVGEVFTKDLKGAGYTEALEMYM